MKRIPKYCIVVLIGLIFLAPGLIAYFFYQNHWLTTASKTNKGLLLNPPIQLTGQPASLKHSQKWQLILWMPTQCSQECLQQIDQLARIRLALGRRLYQVETWVWLGNSTQAFTPNHLQDLQEQDIQLTTNPRVPKELQALKEPQIFIANPQHYLVLAYKVSSNPKDIFHDMKCLLGVKE